MLWGNVDIALFSLYLFWLFFALLVVWLQRENMREGYPLISEVTGKEINVGAFGMPTPKTFKIDDGTEVTVPRPNMGDTREVAAEAKERFIGAPLHPTGDPLLDGVGPASWAERRDIVELTAHGDPKIVPMPEAEGFYIVGHDAKSRAWPLSMRYPDPRGWPVKACDKKVVGTVKEIWIDRGEVLARYFEVQLEDRTVLVPKDLAQFSKWSTKPYMWVESIRSDQFANVPATKEPNRVTRLEEEKIAAYFCGGKLYATEGRQEPLL